jgi:AraC-like DNA-binding protein
MADTQRTSSIATRFLVELLDAAGVPCDDLLAAIPADRAALAGADLRTPWPVFAALWQRAARVDPAVGLHLSERFPTGQMHVVTHLVLRSATVGAALTAGCAYFETVSPAERMTIAASGGRVAVRYRLAPPNTPIPWLVEHYFAMTVGFLGRALGRALPISAVAFRHPALAPAEDYVAHFGVAPQFDAHDDRVTFPVECLAWPLPTHDAYLRDILERVAAQQMPVTPVAEWSGRVAERLARDFLSGRKPALSATATALGLGADALRARLSAEGQTFRRLCDDVCRRLAREHLDRGLSATSVSYLLGFSEPAAFQHACRRWFGKAAGAVRRM